MGLHLTFKREKASSSSLGIRLLPKVWKTTTTHRLCEGYCVWSIQGSQLRHHQGPSTAHLATCLPGRMTAAGHHPVIDWYVLLFDWRLVWSKPGSDFYNTLCPISTSFFFPVSFILFETQSAFENMQTGMAPIEIRDFKIVPQRKGHRMKMTLQDTKVCQKASGL